MNLGGIYLEFYCHREDCEHYRRPPSACRKLHAAVNDHGDDPQDTDPEELGDCFWIAFKCDHFKAREVTPC